MVSLDVDIEGADIEFVPIPNQPCIGNDSQYQIYCLDVHRIDPSSPLHRTTRQRTWGRREEGEGGAGVGNLDPRGPVGSREEGEGGVGGGHLDRRARSGGRASGRREQRRHAKRADGAAPARGASGREVRGD